MIDDVALVPARRNRERDEPEVDFGADGHFTAESVKRLRVAAKAGHVLSMANLGAHLYRQGRLREAIAWSQRAWEAGNVMAGFKLGAIHLEAGDTHLADMMWQKVAALGDADADANATMCVARLALQRDDREAAESWVEPLLSQDQPYPIAGLGVACHDSGDELTAMRFFDRAIALGDGFAIQFAARIH